MTSVSRMCVMFMLRVALLCLGWCFVVDASKLLHRTMLVRFLLPFFLVRDVM